MMDEYGASLIRYLLVDVISYNLLMFLLVTMSKMSLKVRDLNLGLESHSGRNYAYDRNNGHKGWRKNKKLFKLWSTRSYC